MHIQQIRANIYKHLDARSSYPLVAIVSEQHPPLFTLTRRVATLNTRYFGRD
jgi:hypothetical protein